MSDVEFAVTINLPAQIHADIMNQLKTKQTKQLWIKQAIYNKLGEPFDKHWHAAPKSKKPTKSVKSLREIIEELLADGKVHTRKEVCAEVKKHGYLEPGTTLTNLIKAGKIKRVGTSEYQRI